MTADRNAATLELVGGSLCLDFTNTVNSWLETKRDYLATYEDFLAWAEHAGAISSADRSALAERAVADPGAADAALSAARDRRAEICHVLGGVSDGDVPADELASLMAAHADSLAEASYEGGSDGFRPAWRVADELAAPLLPITNDAGSLLLSAEVSRVRTCPSCGWLFLDRSRNGRRRWCSMETCGSRTKMRRYRRKRGARTAVTPAGADPGERPSGLRGARTGAAPRP
jgi:predicted RNA-binding Zn ribbon-like protein